MKKFYPYLLIIILLIPTFWRLLLPGYFSMHDDLQVMRIFEIEKCLSDGQIPCRWAPDMGAGFGQPMFNFYGPFPYYFGAFLRILLPLSIMAVVRMLFVASLIFASLGIYLLAKEFWGNKAGILAAVFYAYAPYHALDIYVRGALSESFALAILPFLWLGIYRLIEKGKFSDLVLTAISLFALFTTHNISSLIYAPFALLWGLFWLWKTGKWRKVVDLFIAGMLGISLSAYSLFPNIIEQGLIKKESLAEGYFVYSSHFVSLRQLFLDREWGYGPSTFGPNDEMSFQIGWPHWWIGIALAVFSLHLYKKKKRKDFPVLVLMILIFAGVSAYMTHLRSHLIWETIEILRFVQFPWRFLGLTIFFLSFSGGAFLYLLKTKKKFVFWTMILLTIILNFSYFKPEHYWSWVTDKEKLSGIQFELQQKAAILDYLPITVEEAPKKLAFGNPKFILGKGTAYNFSERSNRFFFDADVQEKGVVQVPIIYYPGWIALEMGSIIETYPSGKLGLITMELDSGRHIIQGRFVETPLRRISNLITLTTFFLFISIAVYKKEKGEFLGLK